MLNQLAKVLESRGFLITLNEDHIYFSKGNENRELHYIKEMFNELNLNVRFEDRKIYLMDNIIPTETLKNILWYPPHNHEAGGGSGWRSWKYFSKRNHGPKINTFSLETGVARLVKAISAAGIVTICSCNGHERHSPVIHFCGHHNAIWFEVLLDKIKPDLSLHYDWYIDRTADMDIPLKAKRAEVGWNLEYILEDTNQMADYFIKNAEYLSKLKRELFGKKKKSTRKLVKEMNFNELYQWMSHRYLNYHSIVNKQVNH